MSVKRARELLAQADLVDQVPPLASFETKRVMWERALGYRLEAAVEAIDELNDQLDVALRERIEKRMRGL